MRKLLTLASLAIAGASSALAGFTSVTTPWNPNGLGSEVNLDDFGQGGTTILGTLATAWSTSFIRQNDTGGGNDQVWCDAPPPGGDRAMAAIYAGFIQHLGLYEGTSGGTYSQDVNYGSTDGIDTTPNFTGFAGTSDPFFRWGRASTNRNGFAPDSTDYQYSSLESENGRDAGRDHMVTYLLSGGKYDGMYLICWEDNNEPDSDRDFNDLVVLVSGVKLIPTPNAWLLGLLGVAGLVTMRRSF